MIFKYVDVDVRSAVGRCGCALCGQTARNLSQRRLLPCRAALLYGLLHLFSHRCTAGAESGSDRRGRVARHRTSSLALTNHSADSHEGFCSTARRRTAALSVLLGGLAVAKTAASDALFVLLCRCCGPERDVGHGASRQ